MCYPKPPRLSKVIATLYQAGAEVGAAARAVNFVNSCRVIPIMAGMAPIMRCHGTSGAQAKSPTGHDNQNIACAVMGSKIRLDKKEWLICGNHCAEIDPPPSINIALAAMPIKNDAPIREAKFMNTSTQ
jgi:hypothetical protein